MRYIAVVGSRHARKEHVEAAFEGADLKPEHHVIVSGGARGADRYAREIAFERGFHYVEVPANWDGPHKKLAGFKRNSIIADIADAVIAVWDGKSRGTKDTIDKSKNKKVQVFYI